MAVTLLPETKRVLMKQSFEDGLKESSNHFLSDPIPNRGNAERAALVFFLGDIGSPERVGLVRPIL
jgi:hypothetical protein